MKIYHLIKYLHDKQIDIAMINETNMNYQNNINIKLLKQSLKRIWNHNRTVVSSTPVVHTQKYNNTLPLRQQGGSLIIISPLILHHSSLSGRDPLGRWSWIQFDNRKNILNSDVCKRKKKAINLHAIFFGKISRTFFLIYIIIIPQ